MASIMLHQPRSRHALRQAGAQDILQNLQS